MFPEMAYLMYVLLRYLTGFQVDGGVTKAAMMK
jgi:hypothetical protein